MRPWLLRLTAIALLVGLPPALAPERVLACVCGAVPSPAEELHEATAVFAGTLVASNQFRDDYGTFYLSEFEVSRVWKGDINSTITLKEYWTSCTAYTEYGAENVVFAYARPEDEYLYVGGSCGNTGPLAYYSPEALEALGPGAPPEGGTVVPAPPNPPPDSGETGSGVASASRGADLWAVAVAATLAVVLVALARRARRT